MSKLHDKLKKLRADSGLSVRQVTERTKIDHSTIHRMETGGIKFPTFANVCKMAKLYGVQLSDLE